MGVLEAESRKRMRKNELKRLLLSTVQIAGVLGVALVAPNVLAGMAKLGIVPSGRTKETIKRSTIRLVSQGLLRWDQGRLRLTRRGEIALKQMELRLVSAPRNRKWDKKWRVLIFDIPDYRKGLRDRLRRTLRDIGFVQLQASVWAYPYDCEDFITLLKADFKIGTAMLYLIVDQIENDRRLRLGFGLR